MTHGELQGVLDRMDLAVGAAEAHGRLCGAFCVRESYGAGDWLRDLAADAGAAIRIEPDVALRAAHEETLEALRSPDFAFAPLLPGEDSPLEERVTALAAWCDGFLYGVGSAAGPVDIAKAGDVGEYLDDLSNIAHAELEAGRSREAGESDFVELFEFVRAGAQLAWLELAGARSHAAG